MADVRIPYAGGFTTTPSTRVPYAPSQGGFTAKPSAFAQMSVVPGTGNLNAPNIWKDPENLFYKFAFATEPLAKSQAYQNLNRALNSTPGPAGFKNQFDYLSNLLVKTGLTKNSLGFASALDKVVAASVGVNTDPFSFLENYNKNLANAGGTTVKQPDTTTRYAKQIQTALQFKDLGDARQYYNDSYFTAFGQNPSADLDKKFQDAWNKQVKDQDAPTTTKTTTEYAPIYDKKSKPVIDPKTKKQKVDKFGNPVYSKIALDQSGQKRYTTITTGKTTSSGEGFTADEQKQFLATFLSANAPELAGDPTKLGGTAKSIYDQVVELHKNNFLDAPTLPSLLPLLKSVIGTADKGVATELLTKYQADQRAKAATKYMGIADFLNAGKDASEFVNPLRDRVSQFLESDVSLDDPLMMRLLNFQGEDKKYRLMNDYELQQALVNDPRFGKTSTAKNQSVNAAQALASALGR
jgi:hypothetical protein